MIALGSPKRLLRIVRSQSGRQDSNLRPSAPKALFKKIEHLVYKSILWFEELARAINWLINIICWPFVGEYKKTNF